jgi:hypothetical protein
VSDRTAGSRRARVVVPLVLLAVVAAVLAYSYFPDRDVPSAPTSGAAPASSDALTGEWSGDGAVTQCAGFDRCEGTRPVSLTIDCSGKRCVVVPFDAAYGRPPLRFADGRYRAVGPLPPGVAPTCGGAPTSTAQWRLELALRDGRLRGSYAESSVQSFDCGATGVTWDVVLDRR